MTRNDVPVAVGRVATWRRPGRSGPIVVIHGGPDVGSGYLRAHLPVAMPEDADLFFLDLPGVGRSSLRKDLRPTVEAMTEGVREAARSMGVERPSILAHSFGALVALRWVLEDAEGIDRLLLVDPDPPVRSDWDRALAALEARRSGEDRRWLASAGAGEAWRETPEAAEAYLRVLVRPHAHPTIGTDGLVFDLAPSGLTGFGEVGRSVRAGAGAWDLRSGLRGISCPTLIVTGPASPYPLAVFEDMAARMQNARVSVLPDTGHFPFFEAPDRFRAAVAAFLTGADDARSGE